MADDDVIEIPADWRESWEQKANRHTPWLFYVCGKDGQRLELVRDPQALSLTMRHNAVGTGSLTLPAEHPRTPELMADGARWAMRSLYGGVLATGVLRGDQGQAHYGGEGTIGTATWTLVDDLAALGDWLVFPPAGQAQERLTGPAESVARTLILSAASRLGLSVVFPTSLGRGPRVTVTARYQPLSDVLWPVLTAAGLSLRVIRNTAGAYVFSVREPGEWPKEIHPDSGVVESWDWSRAYPALTRVHVLGPREGAERLTRTRINVNLESALGAVREGTIDARDVDDVDPEADPPRTLTMVYTEMNERGDLALSEAARTVGLRVTLSNTPELAFGQPGGLQLGDVLRVRLIPSRPLTLVPVTSVDLSWSTGDGFTVRPTAGEFADTPSKAILARINELAVGLRQQKVSV